MESYGDQRMLYKKGDYIRMTLDGNTYRTITKKIKTPMYSGYIFDDRTMLILSEFPEQSSELVSEYGDFLFKISEIAQSYDHITMNSISRRRSRTRTRVRKNGGKFFTANRYRRTRKFKCLKCKKV